jgi:serine/threonine-protein kinase
VLFELIAGHPPFQDADPFALAFMHTGKSPPRLSSLVGEVPPELERVLEKMLSKRAASRYPDILAAARALEEAA